MITILKLIDWLCTQDQTWFLIMWPFIPIFAIFFHCLFQNMSKDFLSVLISKFWLGEKIIKCILLTVKRELNAILNIRQKHKFNNNWFWLVTRQDKEWWMNKRTWDLELKWTKTEAIFCQEEISTPPEKCVKKIPFWVMLVKNMI